MSGFFKKVLIFLGLAEEEEEFLEEEEEERFSRGRFTKPVVKYSGENKREYVKRINKSKEFIQSEVYIIEPHSFSDSQVMGEKFKANIPVIINLQGVDQDLAKRVIDFASGITYGLDGGIQRVADRVFLLTPYSIEVSAEERIRLQEKGLFNQF